MKTSYLFLLAFLANTFLKGPSERSSHESTESTCSVCMEPIKDDKGFKAFECDHSQLCTKCASDWFKTKKNEATCPLCRAATSPEKLVNWTIVLKQKNLYLKRKNSKISKERKLFEDLSNALRTEFNNLKTELEETKGNYETLQQRHLLTIDRLQKRNPNPAPVQR